MDDAMLAGTRFRLPQVMPREAARVAIASSQPLTCLGLRLLLDQNKALQWVGESPCSVAALNLIHESQPDLVVVDIARPLRKSLGLIRRLRASSKTLRILASAAQPEWLLGVRALRAGANSFVHKSAELQEILLAVDLCINGHSYVNQASLNQFFNTANEGTVAQKFAQLSDCELDVFYYLVDGTPVSQIKRNLHITEKAISNYKSRVIRALGITLPLELRSFASSHGLSPP
jgi:two-component system, NarL family, response regulator EvgA